MLRIGRSSKTPLNQQEVKDLDQDAYRILIAAETPTDDDTTLADKTSRLSEFGHAIVSQYEARDFIFPLGGQFLLDPNEINGWQIQGPYDDSNTGDLGNANSTNLSQNAGGLSFPWDVKLLKFYAWHRNNNSSAHAWGWVLWKQQKTNNSSSRTTTFIVNEPAGNNNTGTRDYNNTNPQLTDLDLSEVPNNVIPAGNVLGLGVSAPTAQTTNRYVQIMSGYFHLERV